MTKTISIFPVKVKKFKLMGTLEESMERLTRRTEIAYTLTSRYTDRSFIGEVNHKDFRLISSSIGKGAFCVMTGQLNSDHGVVRVEVHQVFRYLFGLMLIAPLLAFLYLSFLPENGFSFLYLLVAVGQILMIRFIFLGILFNLFSKESLNKLRDTLDFEWV